MIEVARDMMNLASLELGDLIFLEPAEILVRAVDKADIVFELAYLLSSFSSFFEPFQINPKSPQMKSVSPFSVF